MAGESSSRAGQKRKKAPASTPRQVPAQQENAREKHQKRREILYSAPETLTICTREDLRRHTLLQFQEGTREAEKCDVLVDTELLVPRTIDWDWLHTVGQRERIEGLLGPRFKRVLTC